MRLILIALTLLSVTSFAAPECNIDSREDGDRLVNLISGSATGFLPKEPVFVTVSNGGKEYTMQASRSGKWAVVYANLDENTSVLCWQGFPTRTQIKGSQK